MFDRKNENKTENRDINAADNIVDDTKPCCHINNKVIADYIPANPVIVDNQYYNAPLVLSYDDYYNANPQGDIWQHLEQQQLFQGNNNMSNILAISTYNYQTNAQQQSSPDEYEYAMGMVFMQLFGDTNR
nr:1768_t:CDS:2 [Entrophospora candida]